MKKSMIGYVSEPKDVLRIGIVGLGQRGADALHTLSLMPGVKIAAICDRYAERTDLQLKWLAENKKAQPEAVFTGDEGWKALCEYDLDLVYNVTPWALHVPVALQAMECGKHVATEVPAAFTLEQCWQLVETSERTRRHCVELENCCYGETELLTLQLIRAGMFGELKHAECAYIHDLRQWCYDELKLSETAYGKTGYDEHWRLKWNLEHVGNQYPTHGLQPICLDFGINRGDRLEKLVSMESMARGFNDWAENHRAGESIADLKVAMGDMNTTLIRTAKGRTIMVQHDIASPRPYSRINLVSGTRGILCDYPLRVAFEKKCGDGAHKWWTTQRTKRLAQKYKHPLWVESGEQAKAVGGHGGMDFIMMQRLCRCLREGLPMDTDVYDLATVCSVCELSEQSVRGGSIPVEIPDFTRGEWKNERNCAL